MKWRLVCRGVVWQAEFDVYRKLSPFLLPLLLPFTSLCSHLPIFPPLLRLTLETLSFSIFKSHTYSWRKCTSHFSPSSFSRLLDYGVDRSRVWEQRSHQLWWGSQFPEVPPHFLRPEPVIPPNWGGLGLSLQPRPEGKTVTDCLTLSQVAECHLSLW